MLVASENLWPCTISEWEIEKGNEWEREKKTRYIAVALIRGFTTLTILHTYAGIQVYKLTNAGPTQKSERRNNGPYILKKAKEHCTCSRSLPLASLERASSICVVQDHSSIRVFSLSVLVQQPPHLYKIWKVQNALSPGLIIQSKDISIIPGLISFPSPPSIR